MDLTAKFRQMCRIVEEEYHVKPHQTDQGHRYIRQEEREFNNKFLKDCYQLNKLIEEFRTEIAALRTRYLLIDQGDEDEKDYIDDQSSIYVNKLHGLQKQLERTHAEKTQRDEAKLHKRLSVLSVEMRAYLLTTVEMRRNLVNYLLKKLEATTDTLTEMKQIRLNKRRQLSALSNYTKTDSIQIIEEEEAAAQAWNTGTGHLGEQQLEQLRAENSNLLLANKEDELVKISRLQNSVVEIMNLQSELLLHLNDQNLQINRIVENNEFIMTDLKASNKQLRKAESSLSGRGNYLAYLLVFSGVMILLIDYIKP